MLICETHYNMDNHTLSALNSEQREVFEECIHGTTSLFCTGQGGTGKSRLLECVVKHFREFPLPNNKLVAVTASTGIASQMIRGMTFHKFAGVGIEEDNFPEMLRRASRGQSKTYWENSDILIIDEISMVSPKFFDNLSLVASNIRNSTVPYGGMRLLMFGDFLQLPPIFKNQDDAMYVFDTDAWKNLNPKTMQLHKIVRQNDQKFIHVLSQLRYGICNEQTEDYIRGFERELEYNDSIEPVKLFAKRNTTDLYNLSKLSTIESKTFKYQSIDSGDLGSLKQCPAPRTLELKEGCQVILIRNTTSAAVNGSIGTVVGFETSRNSFLPKPIVNLVSVDGQCTKLTLNRVTWDTVAPNGKVLSSRKQFPLLLAWAITIHKSQGQTIPRLSIDMEGVFEYSQAYVALSRSSDPNSLQVLNFKKELVIASSACVEFYNKISPIDLHAKLPDSEVAHIPLQHTTDDATGVALGTNTQWEQNKANQPLMSDATIETQIMLGHLSLQDMQ